MADHCGFDALGRLHNSLLPTVDVTMPSNPNLLCGAYLIPKPMISPDVIHNDEFVASEEMSNGAFAA